MFQLNTGSAGPFRMMDQVGLDVVLDIEEHYCAEHPEYPEGPRRLLTHCKTPSKAGWESNPAPGSTTTTHARRGRESVPNGWRAAVTNDALAFAGLITAQGTSDGASQITLRLQEVQAIGAVATTIGVLTALYIAVIRDPRKASQEHDTTRNGWMRCTGFTWIVSRLRPEKSYPPAVEYRCLAIRGGPSESTTREETLWLLCLLSTSKHEMRRSRSA